MTNRTVALFLVIAIQAGCKNRAKTPTSAAVGNSPVVQPADSPSVPAASQDAGAPSASATPQYRYNDPPTAGVGPSVEEAYAAIPHRRTIWDQSGSAVPAEEKEYLQTVFQVLDQAVRVRVAGQQAFSNQRFESADIDAEFDRLIAFVRAMPAPKALGSYHQEILSALASERQFFDDWKSQGDRFPFARDVASHPGVRAASAYLRSAYSELMSKYPNESPSNKDAFFDYHCALDFL
jgi:hypothetical protein